MLRNWHISRRTMLRGLGAAVSLPMLEVMTSPSLRASEATETATRLCYLYIPNGVAPVAWHPEEVDGQGRIVKLNEWMSPLTPHQDELTIFRNFWTPRGNGHMAGTATWLTGGAWDRLKLDVGGASVDQIAAKHFKDTTLLPSLELSTRGEGIFANSLPRNSLSWTDSSTPIPRDYEPRVIFDRMFRSGESGFGNRSVIDAVLEDSKRLQRRVSHQDQKTIDEYLDSVRTIERRIEFARQNQQRAGTTSGLTAALVRPHAGVPEDHSQYMKTMLDMIVLAFWSDATRVTTFMMDHGQSNRYFDFIDGVRGTWHALSHWRDISGKTEDDDGINSWSTRNEKRTMYNMITKWHTDHVAYLVGKLKEIQDHDGSLLDHSMIVYGSSLSDGHSHGAKDLPLLMAGGAARDVKPGRIVGGDNETSMSDLHLAMLHRLGVPTEEFADSKSPLTLS